MKKGIRYFQFLLLITILTLTACSGMQPSQKKEDHYTKLAEEKNSEFELEPLKLTDYAQEMGVTLSKPNYKKFAVNEKVVIEGDVESYQKLPLDYARIRVYATEDGPAGKEHQYYAPIKKGKFSEEIHFFNGEGDYQIKIMLPSIDRDNYYYDIATFQVTNVNPNQHRDVTYSPHGIEAGLSLQMESSHATANGVFSLKGTADNLTDSDILMIKLSKGTEMWRHYVAIKDGMFTDDIPMYFGKGLHELEILVPDKERENYFQTATKIVIENESAKTMEPIEFTRLHVEHGVDLKQPMYSREKADTTFRLKGTIDPDATFAKETTHLYVKTKKDDDEALEVIPVEDFRFDDIFHLRFGPGIYEVTVSVPEVDRERGNYFRFFRVARFNLESHATEDLRNILPSRGVPSDDPEIKKLAQKITKGKPSDYEKAKAIYAYVAKNLTYDVDKFNHHQFSWDDNALKALQLKSGVCQDYTYVAIALLRATGIEARFIEGYAGGGVYGSLAGSLHSWVEAKVDGKWIIMDPTWGAGYVNGDEFIPRYSEDYFEPDRKEFNRTHRREVVKY